MMGLHRFFNVPIPPVFYAGNLVLSEPALAAGLAAFEPRGEVSPVPKGRGGQFWKGN
jgi:hypothetical protein